ncbi:MAG: hypothetical protein RLZZ237_4092 [Pseudomonadota bacterium]|jgi:hypothetical protein
MMNVSRRSLWLRMIYALCLLGATYNHLLIVAEYDWGWNYGGLPVLVTTFWTALTLIDPLAIVLLFLRPKAGVILTLMIIVADVAINAWVGLTYGIDLAAFLAQVCFLIFVVCTWRMAAQYRVSPA